MGQSWPEGPENAKNVEKISCKDTVANGDAACNPSDPSCRPKVTRFNGKVGDVYTVHCPAGCLQGKNM